MVSENCWVVCGNSSPTTTCWNWVQNDQRQRLLPTIEAKTADDLSLSLSCSQSSGTCTGACPSTSTHPRYFAWCYGVQGWTQLRILVLQWQWRQWQCYTGATQGQLQLQCPGLSHYAGTVISTVALAIQPPSVLLISSVWFSKLLSISVSYIISHLKNSFHA